MKGLRNDILGGAPEGYRRDFSSEEVDKHANAIESLSEQPYVLWVSVSDGTAEVTVVSHDRPGLFSMVTGILAASGMSITGGQVYTLDLSNRDENTGRHAADSGGRATRAAHPFRFFTRRSFLSRRSGRSAGMAASPLRPHGNSRGRIDPDAIPHKVIVDRFSGNLYTDPSEFKTQLRERFDRLFAALSSDGLEAGRRMVAEEVASRIAYADPGEGAALAPISITEDTETGNVTRFTVRTKDTPFFLYSLSNALSLHNISIQRVDIETLGDEVRDTFEVSAITAAGSASAIRDRLRLDQIRLSILLTKQFTFVLDRAPDPFEALRRFDRLIQDLGDSPDSENLLQLFSDKELQRELAILLGASDFVWEDFVRRQREQLLPMLSKIENHQLLSFDESEMEARLWEDIHSGDTGDGADLETRVDRLNAFKDRQSFLIDLDHMLASDVDFFFLSRRLTALAEAVVRAALKLAWEETSAKYGIPRTAAGIPARYAAFGLGKLGGSALGYASDIELLFIYNDSGETDGSGSQTGGGPVQNSEFFEQLFRTANRCIRAKREGIFQTDLRLRPHGDDGPLAVKLERFVEYYSAGGPAHAVERLALIRLRPIDGDPDLGQRVVRIRDEILYQQDSVSIPALRELRRTQLNEKLDAERLNAKFSPGGLVDLEYNVQILQIMHGRHNPALRCPGIHDALEALREEGTTGDEETEAMIAAYRFLRKLINGLRMLRGNAQDLFMPAFDSTEAAHLARRIGYRRGGELSETDALKVDFETHTAVVRGFIERHLGAEAIPGDVEGGPADLVLSPSLSRGRRDAILSRVGVRDAERAAANIRVIAEHSGDLSRVSRVLVLAWDPLKEVADADMALNNWERFVRACPSTAGHLDEILEQPQRLDMLFTIFSASEFLSEILASDPDIFSWITTRATVERTYSDSELARELQRQWYTVAAGDRTLWLSVLRRFRKRHMLRIGTRDICLGASLPVITDEIASLARAIVHVALQAVWCRSLGRLPAATSATIVEADEAIEPARARNLAVFAFGKLGGAELNYSSDIDLLAVCEPTGQEGEFKAYTRIIRALISDLTEFTVDGQCYRVDMRLRPHGVSGALVPPADRVLEYYSRRADLWEKQALLKLSPVAGDPLLGKRFMARLTSVFANPVSAAEATESVAHLRRLAVAQSGETSILNTISSSPSKSRKPDLPAAGQDIKSGEGGIRDIEFAVQVLQLLHAHAHPDILTGNTLAAIDCLANAGIIDAARAADLKRSYTLLRKVEHFLQLYGDRQLHTISKDEVARERLAGTVGKGADAATFFQELAGTMQNTRAFYLQTVGEGD